MQAAGHAPKDKIQLYFACRELVDLDKITKTDPFLVIYEKRSGRWEKLLQTQVIYNELNPEFPERVTVDFYFEEIQPFKVEVFHHNSATDLVYIGEVEFTLIDLTGQKDNTFETPILDKRTNKPNRGNFLARYDSIRKDNEITLEIFGNMLKSLRCLGGANNNFLEIHKPVNPLTVEKYVGQGNSVYNFAEKKIPDDQWVLVAKTENIKINNPKWSKMVLQKASLCSDVEGLPLRFRVMDYRENSGDHRLVGGCITSVNQIKNERVTSLPLTGMDRNPKGQLTINHFNEKHNFTFLDYCKGGLNINLVVGIDFTLSNKAPSDPKSLHRIDPANKNALNPYQEVIRRAADILLRYDTDKQVPVYGFGGVPNYPNYQSRDVSNCFPCNGNFANPAECKVFGLDGIFAVYNYALSNVVLSGPTKFEPLLSNVMAQVASDIKVDPDTYYFLMIITDGQIIDTQAVKDLICKACDLPLSIVIIGVGNEDFKNMIDLDKGRFQNSFNKTPSRDIVRFIEFEKVKNDLKELDRQMLAEIPDQVVSYYASINKPPNQTNSRSGMPVSATGFRMPAQQVVTPVGNVLTVPQGRNVNYPAVVTGYQPPALVRAASEDMSQPPNIVDINMRVKPSAKDRI